MVTISKELAERVCPCAAVVEGRVYPLPTPPAEVSGNSWTDLVREVANVLWAFEFPTVEPDSADWYALNWCLYRFVYGHQARGRHGRDPGAGDGPAAESGPGGAA